MTTWILITLAIVLIVRRVFLGYSGTARKFKVLARREVALISSTAEVMFPADGAIPFSGIEADLPGFADRFLAALPPSVRWQIRALFMLFEHGTLLFPGPGWTGMRRFSSLTLEQRELVLQRWSQSSKFFRQICFSALRAVLTMGYLGHPVVVRHLRLAPFAMETPLCEADLFYPAIGQHPDQIPYTEQDLGPPSDGTPLDIEGPLHPDYAVAAPGSTTTSTNRSTDPSSETIS